MIIFLQQGVDIDMFIQVMLLKPVYIDVHVYVYILLFVGSGEAEDISICEGPRVRDSLIHIQASKKVLFVD